MGCKFRTSCMYFSNRLLLCFFPILGGENDLRYSNMSNSWPKVSKQCECGMVWPKKEASRVKEEESGGVVHSLKELNINENTHFYLLFSIFGGPLSMENSLIWRVLTWRTCNVLLLLTSTYLLWLTLIFTIFSHRQTLHVYGLVLVITFNINSFVVPFAGSTISTDCESYLSLFSCWTITWFSAIGRFHQGPFLRLIDYK